MQKTRTRLSKTKTKKKGSLDSTLPRRRWSDAINQENSRILVVQLRQAKTCSLIEVMKTSHAVPLRCSFRLRKITFSSLNLKHNHFDRLDEESSCKVHQSQKILKFNEQSRSVIMRTTRLGIFRVMESGLSLIWVTHKLREKATKVKILKVNQRVMMNFFLFLIFCKSFSWFFLRRNNFEMAFSQLCLLLCLSLNELFPALMLFYHLSTRHSYFIVCCDFYLQLLPSTTIINELKKPKKIQFLARVDRATTKERRKGNN